MADYTQAKKDISDILTGLKRKFEITHVFWTNNNRNFEAKFRTQINRNSTEHNTLCDDWVSSFSDFTKTVWVDKISNTGPKVKFRKQYQCWPFEGKIIQKQFLFDKRRCNATLDMKVLTDNASTKRKNKHIKVGLNIVVKMNFNHHHEVNPENPMAFFIQNCEPLPELPKQVIPPNDRLPKLIEQTIEKGPLISQRAAAKAVEFLKRLNGSEEEVQIENKTIENDSLELQSVSEYAEVVVTAPENGVVGNILLSDPLLMDGYQQVIPIANVQQANSSQYIQVQTQSVENQNLQYI